MADSVIDMERFAHDVCVHVLEKFGIFKAPDDTRKQNIYISYDFLPCVSRSVVSYSICIRDSFKTALEEKYKTADLSDKEKMWNFFDDYLLQNDMFVGRDCTVKICVSLALCTEYIQFVSTKDFTVSLNKLVIRWREFFDKNLRVNFEAEGGFCKLLSNLKSSQTDQLDNFHKAFISEYCLPYGSRQITTVLLKKCAEKHEIQLDVAIFGVKSEDISEDSFVEKFEENSRENCIEESSINLSRNKDPKQENSRSETSDSEGSSNNTDPSEKTESELSRDIESEASDSEVSHNDLLGIPPHEDMLREIDPFFVENIPSPPKPQSSSKSPERRSSDNPESSSKCIEVETTDSNDNSQSFPEQDEIEEKVEEILSNLEHCMHALRALLFEHGLISVKSGRKGRRMQIKNSKDKPSPKDSEGLI